MKTMKAVVAENIVAEFHEFPKFCAHLLEKLLESETPEDFADYCYQLAEKLNYLVNTDFVRSNWHPIHCECDDCMRLQYGDEACD